jgi:hypothetical protein
MVNFTFQPLNRTGKLPLKSNGYEAGRTIELVWMLWGRGKTLASDGNSNSPAAQPVTSSLHRLCYPTSLARTYENLKANFAPHFLHHHQYSGKQEVRSPIDQKGWSPITENLGWTLSTVHSNPAILSFTLLSWVQIHIIEHYLIP